MGPRNAREVSRGGRSKNLTMLDTKKPSWGLHPANQAFPVYSQNDLDEFEEWLKQFTDEKVFKDPRDGKETTYHPLRIWDAMVAFGAAKKQGDEYTIVLTAIEHGDNGHIKTYERPTKQELFDHKLAALEKRSARKEFAETRRMEAYEKMVEGMEVDMPAAEPVERAEDGRAVLAEVTQGEIF